MDRIATTTVAACSSCAKIDSSLGRPAMRILCVLGKHAYGRTERGEGYEHANFLPALRALGHEVEFFESLDRNIYKDFAELNMRFVERVEAFRPDLIFCVLLGYELWTEALDVVRGSSAAAVLNWGTDDSWKYAQFTRFLAPHVDLYVTTYQSAYAAAQAEHLDNVVLSQWAANGAALAGPIAARDCAYSVSFIGTAYGNRRRWISALAARGIEVACFGHGWRAGPVSNEEMRRIVRESAISLNFGDSGVQWRGVVPYRSRQVKARIFEIPGSGGFLLTESAPELARFYAIGDEIDVFDSADEAAQKIRHYLANPDVRDRMADAAYARTAREHTYAQRFAPLLEEARRRKRHASAAMVLDDCIRAHAASPGLRALRLLLTAPAVLLFGSRRGPRAARRLLFELSWRTAGARTYSASGWPGRLFYRES